MLYIDLAIDLSHSPHIDLANTPRIIAAPNPIAANAANAANAPYGLRKVAESLRSSDL